jgi:hypothetical protein
MSTAAKLRQIALEQPEAEEAETWGHPTFRVDGHIFVGLDEVAGTANIKATLEAQAALVSGRPDVFSVSPRVGQSGWVTVVLADVPADELRELVADAWRLTTPSGQSAQVIT